MQRSQWYTSDTFGLFKLKNWTEEDIIKTHIASYYGAEHWYPVLKDYTMNSELINFHQNKLTY